MRDGDEVVLARELSGDLFDADLLCEGPNGTLDNRCVRPQIDYSARGFLGDLRADKGDGRYVERPAFSPVHVANSTWKRKTAARGVARGVTP